MDNNPTVIDPDHLYAGTSPDYPGRVVTVFGPETPLPVVALLSPEAAMAYGMLLVRTAQELLIQRELIPNKSAEAPSRNLDRQPSRLDRERPPRLDS